MWPHPWALARSVEAGSKEGEGRGQRVWSCEQGRRGAMQTAVNCCSATRQDLRRGGLGGDQSERTGTADVGEMVGSAWPGSGRRTSLRRLRLPENSMDTKSGSLHEQTERERYEKEENGEEGREGRGGARQFLLELDVEFCRCGWRSGGWRRPVLLPTHPGSRHGRRERGTWALWGGWR